MDDAGELRELAHDARLFLYPHLNDGGAHTVSENKVRKLVEFVQAHTTSQIEKALEHPSTVRGYQMGLAAGKRETESRSKIDHVMARIQTAERILHKGFVIPEMEVQLQDEIDRLKGELATLKPSEESEG